MNKHQKWLNGRNNPKNSNDFQSFSLFQFSLKIILSINILLSLLLLIDYFIRPNKQNAICKLDYQSQVEVMFSNGDNDIIKMDNKWRNKIKGGEEIEYFSTPIFNHSKYLNISLDDGIKLQINNYEIVAVLFFVIFNTLAFILFVLYPNFVDSGNRQIKDSISSNFTQAYNFYDHVDFVSSFIAIPTLMGFYYWYLLYNYLSSI